MNVLITGANGLVGSAAIRRFVAEKYQVKALCRKDADLSLISDLINEIEVIEGDVMDALGLYQHFKNADVVLHTAAVVSFNPKERTKMYRVNVEGTANVVNACLEADVKHLLFVSSVAALGRPANLNLTQQVTHIDESQKWEESSLNSHYAKSKYLAECEVWRGQAEGLKVAIVNPSVILGEGDWSRSSTQLFKYVYDENRFYTLGSLNYIDLKDLTEVIFQLVKNQVFGERFIVNAGTITYKEFFEKVAVAFGKKPPQMLIKPWMTEILWRIEALRSKLSGASPLITKETSKSARTHFHYENDKVRKNLNVSFTPINETIKRVTDFLS